MTVIAITVVIIHPAISPPNRPRAGPAGHADDGPYVLAGFDGDAVDNVVVVVGVRVGQFDDLGTGDLALGVVVRRWE